jgi:AICAR transformylase/IMP cyclohydrolase PurH
VVYWLQTQNRCCNSNWNKQIVYEVVIAPEYDAEAMKFYNKRKTELF